MKQDQHDPELRRLLSNLLLYETRPAWVAWARQQLAVGKLPQRPVEPEGAQPLEAPEPAEEIPPGDVLGKLRALDAEPPDTAEPSLEFPADGSAFQ